MKIRRALLKSGVAAVAVAFAGGAAWWAAEPAQAVGVWNTSIVKIRGTVTDPGESVSFSGDAKVGTRLAPDPDFGAPSLVMSIDLTGISGWGASSEARYVIEGPEIVQKRLAPSYTVDITFPFYRSTSTGSTARTGIASFALNVNTATGAVTSATGSITTPDL